MKIETHFIGFNIQDTIGLTIRHYSALGKVFYHDNHSTDLSREIAKELGAEVSLFGIDGVLSDEEYVRLKNTCWNGSQADWVIIVDNDEIFYDPFSTVQLQLAKDSGATIVQPKGFSIFSNEMPEKDWTEIMTGIPDEKYSKLCCFDPKKIKEINYVYGCHEARPKGEIRIVNKCYLLHYHGVGGVHRMIDRHRMYEPRRQRSAVNMRWGLGKEYGYSKESKIEWFQERLERSAPLHLVG